MLTRPKQTTEKKDQGFTLIELLVVIVIIGILAAVAIPMFLNQRQKGVDAGVKSDLKALATTMETIYTDTQTYSATAGDITGAGFNKTTGNDVDVALSGSSFCIRGSNDDGSRQGATGGYFWYDPASGGLQSASTAPTGGDCAGTLTWTAL